MSSIWWRSAVLAAAVLVAGAALAQDWPKQKPVQFLVGFGPGSSTDILSRLIGAKLAEALGQAVVVENRAGAGGSIAARQVKAAAPDGYTLLVISVSYAVNQISSTSVPPAVPQVKAGKVRAIAVTSAQRTPALPDVPTLNEQGLSGFDDLTWFAFFAPAGTPAEVVARLNAEVNRVLELPDVKEKLGQLGLESRRNTPEEFGAYLREEIPKWAKAVKDSGAKAD